MKITQPNGEWYEGDWDEVGFDSIVRKDPGLRNGVYIYNGILTNQFLGEAFNLPFKDINLLMAAI